MTSAASKQFRVILPDYMLGVYGIMSQVGMGSIKTLTNLKTGNTNIDFDI